MLIVNSSELKLGTPKRMLSMYRYCPLLPENSNKAWTCDSPVQGLKDILCSSHNSVDGLKLKYAFEEVVVKLSVVLLSLFIHDWPQSSDIFTFSSSALRALLRA